MNLPTQLRPRIDGPSDKYDVRPWTVVGINPDDLRAAGWVPASEVAIYKARLDYANAMEAEGAPSHELVNILLGLEDAELMPPQPLSDTGAT